MTSGYTSPPRFYVMDLDDETLRKMLPNDLVEIFPKIDNHKARAILHNERRKRKNGVRVK